ncbi:putative Tigger transposable element-derived protein 1-like 239 [Homarus americanus]|uniref:Putative Tigger transposable element-derived protein 1-like 239 n=1 Tax=Homarus americanus TaxID=6706 RepID=A0A8J5JBM5_HOMAM|nr:putative Tigger transposable element-derived protein 1-like 239 [Homarus americanus]
MIKYCQNKVLLKVENLLVSYLIRQARRNMAVDTRSVQEYARELYAAVSRKMGIAEPKPFNASSGWLHRFKRRNNITNINIGGEEASADRLQKERITVLFTTNASGTCKPKLSVIHTARKPHAYKNVDMSKINVHWLTARMTQPVTVALDLAREAVHSITAEGFSETTNEDILEVIRDPEMTADEMLEDDNVSEEEEKLKLFLSNDPDDDLYEVFHTRLVQAMEPYIKVYQDNINTSRQKSISEFFARNPPQPARASDSDSESDFEGFVREALTTMTDSDGDAPSNGDSPEGQ